MKISISYPPLESKKGTPTLSQNRQFQWFTSPTYIYPVVPASAATFLKQNGYEVFWDDGIAEELSYQEWLARIIKEKPDIIAIETKTPVIKRHWEIIEELKNKSLEIENWKLKIIFMGDHVTALPEESFYYSPVDFVLTGGDYDFMLLNLANHLSKGEELDHGWYYCHPCESRDLTEYISNENQGDSRFRRNDKKESENDNIVNTGHFQLNHDLNSLPLIDRELTHWQLYAFKNGNFKYVPGAYIMSSRDCWYGKCTFCSWANTLFPNNCYRIRKVENVLDEIGSLIKLGAKEIMDDSGTFPIGEWLKEFCHGMIERGYHKKVKISCNMRINAIKDLKIYQLMKQAGFRMILFGLESANQKTLDKINKGLKAEEIEPCLKICKKTGLEPHITVMVGYPWETREETENTLSFAKKLFRDGMVDSLQATIMIPYPGTKLFKEFIPSDDEPQQSEGEEEPRDPVEKDWNTFDQSQQVLPSQLSDAEIKKMIQKLYRSFFTPRFFWNKIKSIRSLSDIKFYLKAGLKVLGHLGDFSYKK